MQRYKKLLINSQKSEFILFNFGIRLQICIKKRPPAKQEDVKLLSLKSYLFKVISCTNIESYLHAINNLHIIHWSYIKL